MTRAPIRPLPGLTVLIVLAAFLDASTARAQRSGGVTPSMLPGGSDHLAPFVTLLAPTGDVYTPTPLIKLDFCDDSTLNASSRLIQVNGVNRTSSFDYVSAPLEDCGAHKRSSSTSVTLDPGQNTLYAYICDNRGNCTGQSFYVTRRWGPQPIVDLSPYNADNQDMARCVASCFAAAYAQSTVPYFSLDTPRNITLAYHGDRLAPRPFIHVNVEHGGDGNLPTAFRLQVKKADGSFITFVNGETTLRFASSAGQWLRLAGQFDAAANGMGTTGVYAITVIVGAEYSGGNEEVTNSTKLIVVDEASSPVARGWTLAGIQRLYLQGDGSALITEGDGSAVHFQKVGGSFTRPAGEFSGFYAGFNSYTRIYPDSTRVTFDNTGRMTQIQDPFGNTTMIGYDGSGRVSQVTDPTSNSITLGYGANGLATITDPMLRQSTVTVDGSRRLTAIADPDFIFSGIPTTFGYDGSLRLDTITDRRGSTTTLAYDAQSGKLASVTAPAVPIFGQGTVSPVTSFAAWQKVSVPYGPTSGTPLTPARSDTVRGSLTDPGGHQTRFTVNRFGQPQQSTGPLGDTVTVAYNANGQPLAVTDRLGVNASYSYDATGFTTSATVGGVQTFYRNGGWGRADSVWGAGPVQRYFLGIGGRADSIAILADIQYRIRFQYDDDLNYATHATHSRLVFSWGLTSNMMRSWYTGLNGNRSKDSVPGGRVTRYLYNSDGLPHEVASSDGAWRIISYDHLNRPISVNDAVNPNPTVYSYDSLFLKSVTDPKGQVYQFGYNALGWATSRTDPAGRAESFAYDLDGLLREWTNRRGQVVDLTYDELHRRRTRTGVTITPDTVTYSADGRTVTASNSNATEISYLNARLQADSARTTLWIPGGGSQSYLRRYWYNSTNALLDSVRPSGGGLANLSRGYAYTPARGTLDSIRLGTAGWTRLVYGANLSLQKYRFPGTATDTLGFGYVTAQDLRETQSPLMHDMYHYDSLGHLDEARSVLDQWTRMFTYDTLGHLRSVSYSSQVDPYCYLYDDTGWYCTPTFDSTRVLSYDQVGNRTDLGGTYATGNRITAFNGCTYGSDNDGNVTSRGCPGQSVTFGWSADGRLTTLSVAGGSSVNFQYDAAGRLVRRDVNGVPASYFLWHGEDLLAELGSNAYSEVAQYSHYAGLDRLHAFIWGSIPYYGQQDGLGSVRFVGDAYTGAAASYQYNEWGQVTGGGGSAFGINRAQWKGALYMAPEAGLYYMRNRWYEPQTGRFLSEDPAGLAAGINPYLFAGDDPISGVDPTGLQDPQCPYQDKTKCKLPAWVVPGSPDNSGYRGDAFTLWEFNLFWATAERTCGYNPSLLCIPPDQPPPPPRRAPNRQQARPKRSWGQCALAHFGLKSLVTFAGATPVPKTALRLPRLGETSEFTNPVSLGRFLFGDVRLPVGVLGTRSLFGALGRANILVAAGTFAYDATSIALCALTTDPDYGP